MGSITVRILPEDKVVTLDAEDCITVVELLVRLGVSRESAVAVRGGEVLPEWARVCPGEEVEVYLAVSSG